MSVSDGPPPDGPVDDLVTWPLQSEHEGGEDPDLKEVVDRFLTMVRSGQVEPPLMPVTVRQAMEMSRDPKASYAVLSNIIETDPSLAAQLLRLANSPLFGARERVGGLRLALIRIGIEGLRELLFAASVSEILVVPGDPQLSDRLVQRALAVAICAQALAREASLDDDEAFTAGLLHDIGLPLAFGLVRSERRRLPDAVVNSPGKKRQICERIHEVLGRELAHSWGMPEQTTLAIGFHHQPGAAPGTASLAWVVCAARSLSDYLGVEPEGSLTLEQCPALQELGVSVERAEEIAESARVRLASES